MISRRKLIVDGSMLLTSALFNRPALSNPTQSPADLILSGGEIHTVDPKNRRVEAMAIRDNKVLAIGTKTEIRQYSGLSTREIKLDGQTVLPGINDSHIHLQSWAMSRPPYALDLTYPRVKSIRTIIKAVKQAAATLQPTDWIIGRGWDQAYLKEGRAPNRTDLDAVAPYNPVVLTEFSGHAVWVNTAALKFAGITRDSSAEAGGVIVKDEKGEPTGLLFEGPAFRMRSLVPAANRALIENATIAAMQELLKRGITSATDPGLPVSGLEIYRNIVNQNRLMVRINGMLKAGFSTEELQVALSNWQHLKSPSKEWLQLNAVKIMGDGIPTNNNTAWLNEPYESGGNGSLLLDGDTDQDRVRQLRAMIAIINDAGLQAGTHVTGSRSIDEAVTACAIAQKNSQRANLRHYLIHADLVSEVTLARMAELGIGANFNPEIKHLIADSQVASIGPIRAAYEWPYRSAIEAGVTIASSSDAPVTDGNWLQGTATCMDRRGKQTGKVSGPAQRISLDEAIRTYTIAGAWQDHSEHFKGSLEVGKVADFCVLDGRLSSSPTDQFPSMKVALTAVDGRIVHDRI